MIDKLKIVAITKIFIKTTPPGLNQIRIPLTNTWTPPARLSNTMDMLFMSDTGIVWMIVTFSHYIYINLLSYYICIRFFSNRRDHEELEY